MKIIARGETPRQRYIKLCAKAMLGLLALALLVGPLAGAFVDNGPAKLVISKSVASFSVMSKRCRLKNCKTLRERFLSDRK